MVSRTDFQAHGTGAWGAVISYSTIYCAIKTGYMEPKERKKKKDGHYFMERYLRRKGWRGKKKEKQEKAYIHRGIEERPKSAENRSRFGHYEGDYSSCHKLYIVTLVDRPSSLVNPKFCVNSILGANRAKFICGGSRVIRLPPFQQHNAGGTGCQGCKAVHLALDTWPRRCQSGMRSAK